MVQRKVASNKLAHANSILKAEKRQAIIKPSLQNHDGKSKGADLKAVKMKKSRSVKRSNVDISLQSTPEICEASQQQGKPPLFVTPSKTPSPKKALPSKSPYNSPNYMKSTSSSEARKERTAKVISNTTTSSSSKLHHRVTKSLNKISSFRKVRSLTKSPTFKHTRSGACKNVVLCQSDLDVQRATCSSILKDSKFPSYLKLKPGATEAEGNSVFKVCPYTYCSLNGHHHISAPPLKRFMSSRRRLLKTPKGIPEALSPQKDKQSESKQAKGEGDQHEDFFVEVHVSDRKIITQVSVSLSDGPCSEMDFQDEIDQTEDTDLSGGNFSPEDEDFPPTLLRKQTSFESQNSSRVSLVDYFGENSDMEWEEGQLPATRDNCESYILTDDNKEQDKQDIERKSSASRYLEFVADDYPTIFHDEIVDCLSFSDTDSLPDSESTQTGDMHVEVLVMATDDMDSDLADGADAHARAAELEDESINEQCRIFSDSLEGITEAQNEELDSYQDLVETDGEESNEVNYTLREIREEDAAEFVMKESEPSEDTIRQILPITDGSDSASANEEICKVNNDDQTKTDHCAAGNEADESNFVLEKDVAGWEMKESATNSEEDSNEVGLYSVESNDAEVQISEMQDSQETEEAASPSIRNNMQEANKRVSNNRESDSNLNLLDSCSRLRKLSRCRKPDEVIEDQREFNPRGPNFLPIEPEAETEKVDLRHQKMDERKNADEWMLDYALQKTVNQLAPARKRKVALLVAAFESVLPAPQFESHMSRISSGFAQARPIQACK